MKIPKYWRKVSETVTIDSRPYTITAWGHSDRSAEDALAQAQQRLPLVRQNVANRSAQRSYDYYADALREHRIKAWQLDGREYAVITRNGYGALVLNTESVMFIDIDVKPCFKFLFWGKSYAQKKMEVANDSASILREGGFAARIYETTSGLRVLVTNRTFDSDDIAAVTLMKRLGADPLYVRLCQSQHCFRARLTPKPWRIDLPKPPQRFPEDPTASSYANWVSRYEEASRGLPTCRLMQTVGSDASASEISVVVSLHDEYCNVGAAGVLV